MKNIYRILFIVKQYLLKELISYRKLGGMIFVSIPFLFILTGIVHDLGILGAILIIGTAGILFGFLIIGLKLIDHE